MPVKTDRKDARGIAQLLRMDWFRPVHCKSLAAQELRAVLTACKLIQSKLNDVELSLRGILRGFGFKVGLTTRRSIAGRVRELVGAPARFRSSRMVGTYFGLIPKTYQASGDDVTGRISKIGDDSVRTVLYEAANIILTRPVKGSALKSWAMRVAKRAGTRKAKVALARKLAVVLHQMLVSGTAFNPALAAAARP